MFLISCFLYSTEGLSASIRNLPAPLKDLSQKVIKINLEHYLKCTFSSDIASYFTTCENKLSNTDLFLLIAIFSVSKCHLNIFDCKLLLDLFPGTDVRGLSKPQKNLQKQPEHSSGHPWRLQVELRLCPRDTH